MNWQSVLVLVTVLISLTAAVIGIVRNHGTTCGGDCAHCRENYTGKKRDGGD